MSNETTIKFDPNSVTGNAGRDMYLVNAIQTLHNRGDDPSVLPSVQLELPKDFDLDADELAAMIEHLGITAPVEAAVADDISPANKSADESVEEVPVEAPPELTSDQARDAVVDWEKRLAHARGARIGAEQKARDMRGKLAKAVQEFVTGFSQLTPEQNVRQMIASEQARKAAGIPLGRPQHRGGPSVVDMAAGNANGNSANRAYAPKFRRGASTQKGALNFDPRKGPVAKLPSQR